MEEFIAHVIRLNPNDCQSSPSTRFKKEGTRIFYHDFAGRAYTVVWIGSNGGIYAPKGRESLGNVYDDEDGGLSTIGEGGELKNYRNLKRGRKVVLEKKEEGEKLVIVFEKKKKTTRKKKKTSHIREKEKNKEEEEEFFA